MPIKKIKNLTSEKLVNMLQQGTADIAEFDKYNFWKFIHRNDWKKVLPEFPQYADKYEKGFTLGVVWWDKLLAIQPKLLEGAKKYKVGWSAIIMHYPELEEECPYWDEFTPHEWSMIISAQPQYFYKCPCIKNFTPKNWAVILSKQPQFRNKCIEYFMGTNWQKKVESLLKPIPQKSYSSYIIEQIENPKTDLDSFDWEKINSEKWIDILKECPQFANRFHGWDKIAMTDWYKLIKAQPQFIESAVKYSTGRSAILKISPNILPDFNDWGNIPPQDWRGILLKQPQLIEHCYNTDALRTKDWLHILKIYPQSETIFHHWQIFDSSDFRELIKYQPQFWIYSPNDCVKKILENPKNADECKCWNDLQSSHWGKLLSECPHLSDFCKSWDFHSTDWAKILSKQPQFADKCLSWDFHSSDWVNLLSQQPQFSNKSVYWNYFTSDDWDILLSKQPQFWIYNKKVSVKKIKSDISNADECKCWDDFNADDFYTILYVHPQLIDKCPDEIFDEFTFDDWDALESVHPNVFERQHMLSTLRKISRDD